MRFQALRLGAIGTLGRTANRSLQPLLDILFDTPHQLHYPLHAPGLLMPLLLSGHYKETSTKKPAPFTSLLPEIFALPSGLIVTPVSGKSVRRYSSRHRCPNRSDGCSLSATERPPGVRPRGNCC
jgi:hypothetical protein